MDIKTIMICLILLNFSLGMLMLLFLRIQKTYPGFIYWALSNILLSFAFVLLSMRGIIHDFFSITIANSVILIVGLLRILGVREFFGRRKLVPSFLVTLFIIFAMVFILYSYYTIVRNDITIRVVINSIVTSAISVYLSFLIIKNIPRLRKFPYVIAAGISIFFALFSISRGFERLVLIKSNSLYDPTPFNSAFFLFLLVFDVAWTTLFLIINNQRLSHELTGKNQELTNSNKIKDRFFAIIAHDLKNPFNGIIGISKLLLDNFEKKESNRIEELLEMIKNTAEQAYALLGNLLNWAKTQIGSAAFNPANYSLGEIVRESIEQVKTSADSKKIRFNNHADNEIRVFVDRDMLNAVVRNLLTNAIKFSYPDSEIVLDALENDARVVLSVKDSGKGISENDIKKLFKPGEIVAGKGTNGEEGSGIGLLLCKEYVNFNSGKIWVESQLGRGSTIYVSLKKSGR